MLRLACFVICFCCVQSLMFPPVPGPDCRDNDDCDSRCCLMTRMRHRRPYGVCQPLPLIGDFCAPGDRLRDYSGWKVYTHSCPCTAGLECVPVWSTRYIAMSVSQDPQCLPANISAEELHVRGFTRPPALPPSSPPRPPSPHYYGPDVHVPPSL